MVAVPETVVIVAEVPVRAEPSVAVTVVAVPLTVCVVSVMVATPLPFVFDVAAENEPLASDFVHVTVTPDVATALLFASASCAVIVTSLPASGLAALDVTRYLVALPTIVVIVADVPVRADPSVAVTVVAVPATVCVVNVTVATPLPFVSDVAVENEPLASDLVHVTVWFGVATALLLASANCAVIVTPLPATGLRLLEVTRYFVAAPAVPVAVKVTGLPASPVDVAVRVLGPAVVPRVQLPTVAIPLAFVVWVSPVPEPPPEATAKVTLTPATGLLFASRTITDGGVVTAVPAVAD